jgi:hypothetical protein
MQAAVTAIGRSDRGISRRAEVRGRFRAIGVRPMGASEGAMTYRRYIGDAALLATIGFLAALLTGAL